MNEQNNSEIWPTLVLWMSRTRTSHINNRLMISEVHKEHANIHSITMNFHAFTWICTLKIIIVVLLFSSFTKSWQRKRKSWCRFFQAFLRFSRASICIGIFYWFHIPWEKTGSSLYSQQHCNIKTAPIKNRNWTMLHLILIVWALSLSLPFLSFFFFNRDTAKFDSTKPC